MYNKKSLIFSSILLSGIIISNLTYSMIETKTDFDKLPKNFKERLFEFYKKNKIFDIGDLNKLPNEIKNQIFDNIFKNLNQYSLDDLISISFIKSSSKDIYDYLNINYSNELNNIVRLLNLQLFKAISQGNIENVKKLINVAGLSVNTIDLRDPITKDTPLIAASYNQDYMKDDKNKQLEIVNFLISKKANVNSQTNLGRSPLILAADQYNEELVKILLNAGADKKLKTSNGNTALDKAKSKKHANQNIIRMLTMTNY